MRRGQNTGDRRAGTARGAGAADAHAQLARRYGDPDAKDALALAHHHRVAERLFGVLGRNDANFEATRRLSLTNNRADFKYWRQAQYWLRGKKMLT
jgi:hypothetical protein